MRKTQYLSKSKQNLMETRSKTYSFPQFFILPPFPRSTFLCASLARRTTIYAINPFVSTAFSMRRAVFLFRKDCNSAYVFTLFRKLHSRNFRRHLSSYASKNDCFADIRATGEPYFNVPCVRNRTVYHADSFHYGKAECFTKLTD